MRLYPWAALMLSLFSASALTSEQQTFTDAASWAKQTANQALQPSSLPLNIDDYCKDAACKREIRNPKESRLSDSDINSQKNLAFAKDETAQAIQNNFNKGKPDIKNDPAMRFALLGQENAFEITHGISNAYVDCDAGTQCLIENHTRICTSPTNNNVPCYSTPVAQVEIGITRYQCQDGWTLKGMTCHHVETQCRFDKSNRTTDSTRFHNCYSSSGYTTTYYWDGKQVYPKDGYYKGDYKYATNYNSCGIATTSLYEICGPVPIEKPAALKCDAGYTLSGAQCIKNTFSWKTDCSLLKDCKKTNQVCIEGPQTRIINGIPTYLDCWKYQVNHLCELSDSCASLPKDCKEQSRSCSLKQNG
ncbi:TPA: conjugal transfer protein TraN, partial [Vibrio harveyi]